MLARCKNGKMFWVTLDGVLQGRPYKLTLVGIINIRPCMDDMLQWHTPAWV